MRKLKLFKSLLVVAMLLVGGVSSVWADETILTPTGGVTTVNTSSSDVAYSGAATSWQINQGGVTGGNIGRYAGPYCLVKFDASGISGTITKATLTFDYASSAYNTSYNVYLLGATDWDATTVIWGTLSDNAKSATSIASGTWSVKSTTGTISYEIKDNVTKALMGMAICCNTGREQTISNIKLTITHTTATVYTATFTETNSLNPTVTIYSDANRTSPVDNGTLTDKTTYYYRAVLEGYKNFEGSFTVNGSGPSVEFTMTAKSQFTYNVYAVNSSSVKLQEDPIATATVYEDETATLTWSKYIKIGGTWYSTSESTFRTTATETGSKNVVYSASDIDYFFEMENLTRSGGSYLTEESTSYSNNSRLRLSRNSLYYTPALTGGTYLISIPWENTNESAGEVYVYTRTAGGDLSEKLETFTANKGSGTFTATITVPDGYSIAFNGNEGGSANNNARMDYMTLVSSVSATITSAGWATLYTPYALDFSSFSSNFKAYTATLSENTVTLNEVTTVPANTGVVLKGAADTYNIPVIASSTTGKGDLKGSATAATAWDGVDGKDLYVLVINSENKAQFTKVGEGSIAAGKAYLQIAKTGGSARMLSVVFDDGDATGISNATAEMKAEDAIFNLAGQRVAQPANGLYIVNGKKVIVK